MAGTRMWYQANGGASSTNSWGTQPDGLIHLSSASGVFGNPNQTLLRTLLDITFAVYVPNNPIGNISDMATVILRPTITLWAGDNSANKWIDPTPAPNFDKGLYHTGMLSPIAQFPAYNNVGIITVYALDRPVDTPAMRKNTTPTDFIRSNCAMKVGADGGIMENVTGAQFSCQVYHRILFQED